MTIPPRKQPLDSLQLTLKVVRAVHQLRRQLKPRVAALTTKAPILGSKACLGLETAALRSIEKGLARASPQSRKQLLHHSNRICKSRRSARPSSPICPTDQDDSAGPNTPGERMQHVLKSLDGNISPALTTAACSDDKVFLKQNGISFDGCSLNETIQCVILVYNALEVLRQVRKDFDDQSLIEKGLDYGLNIDEKFIANYLHILLFLQGKLLETLARKVVESLFENDLDKRQRRLLNWLASSTEHPDDKHLLSTTWPWSLKPSLAVLWGVCWMFYYPNDERGRKGSNQRGQRVPQQRFLQNNEQLREWITPDRSNEYLHYGRELITGTQAQRGQSRRELLRPSGPVFSDDEARAVALSGLDLGMNLGMDGNLAGDRFGTQQRQGHQNDGIALGTTASSPSTYGSRSLTIRDNIQARPSPSPSSADYTPNATLHQQNQYQIFAFTQQSQQPHFNNDHFDTSAWQQSLNRTLPPTHSHLVPTLQAPHPNIYINSPDFSQQQYIDIMGHGRNDSVNDPGFPTPTSMPPTDTHSPLVSPRDNRRPSSVSSFSHGHRRQASDACSSIDGDEDAGSPGHRNHSYKRAEEPPRNADGKMICKHQECTGSTTTFDRKCEWSKHMDKHERPYKCTVKGCEKLQGFTYSGGLLRHEREVHKMHGGTKKSLYCPFADCKRSSGSGFTRKENLAEHVRRVHRRTSMSSDLGHLIVHRADTFEEASNATMSPEMNYPRSILETQEESPFSNKRKRMASEAGISEEGEDVDLRSEVKRLRSALEEKDSRLQQLETIVMSLQRQSQSQSQSQSQR